MDIIEGLPGIFYVIDKDARLVLWNHQLKNALAVPESELSGIDVQRFFDAKEIDLIRVKIKEAFDNGHSSHEATLVGADGRRTPYLFNCARTVLNGVPHVFGTGLDITAQKETEVRLRVRERAMYSSTNAIVITCCRDGEHPIEYVNPAFERITGYTLDEVKGRDPRFMGVPDVDGEQRRRIREALRRERSVSAVLRNTRKNGEVYLNELRIDPVINLDGSVSHFVGVIDDVTKEHQYERRLHYAANHDPLTGLGNRTLLKERSHLAVAAAREHHQLLALALIDLDNFKAINDRHGHQAGDEVLKEVANRLRHNLREDDTIARLGGDEFVLLVSSQPSVTDVADVMERIRVALSVPIRIGHSEVVAGASIGVALFPDDASHAEGLMRAADEAMYRAKARGRNNFQFYGQCVEVKS
jgi:diguanylate cyclase (GGDEF)-like protein/PAS domain S-box-containing protein